MVFKDLAKGSSRPMVVDWAPDDRATLEAHATRGAILVRITENGIEPLWDCAIGDGARYEFAGVSPKRDHVDARSDAELAANFPMGFAKFHSMVKSGQSISADVRMIGVAELNRLSVKRAELPPQCAGATHFVKELTIGGFQFGSAAQRAVGAQAGVGNMGADATYAGVSNRITEEGDFKICEGADPESRTAPGRCKGILRIRLVPIDQDASKVQTTCGAGMRWDGRACVQVDAPAADAVPPPSSYECQKTDLNECLTQCKNGSASSCTLAGNLVAQSGKASMDDLKTLFGKGCEGQSWEGCSALGDVLQVENKDAEAAKLHGLACLNGFSNACTNYGVAAYFGRGGVPQDRALSFKLWERACRLGDFTACSNAGVVVNKGEGGVKPDAALARGLFEVSCKNNNPNGCSNFGFMVEHGIAGPGDKKKALELYAGACDGGNAAACINAGLLVEESGPTDRQRVKVALELYEKACNMQSAGDGCASYDENKKMYSSFYNDEQIERRSCNGSTQSELGCFNAAVVYADEKRPFYDRAKLMEFAKRACKSQGATFSFCKSFR